MKKDQLCAVKMTKQQFEYIESYMYNQNFETISQTVRAIINDSMITNPMPKEAQKVK